MHTENIDYDKSHWGDGPWQSEPDKAYWVDPKTGFDCLIVRNPMGALCGYVGVKPDHKFFGIHYDDVPVEAHGGLTFSDRCHEDGHICHPIQGKEEVWWLGFDCAHLHDFYPAMNQYRETIPGYPYPQALAVRETYKDFAFVKAEVERLAEQLK